MARRAPRDLVVQRFTSRAGEMALLDFPAATPGLTEAELALARRILAGDSNRAIAAQRNTSTRTVANQVAALLRKLGASSRADLAARWLELLAGD